MAAPTSHAPTHAIARAVAVAHEVLDGVADASTWSMDGEETAATLCSLTRLAARVAELEARVAAHASEIEVGERAGATSTATWWACHTRLVRPEAHRRMRLATALAEDAHEPVRVALAAGEVVVEQARMILDAVAALPADLEPALVDRAERHLVAQAAEFDARTLKVLGRRLLEVIAPEAADAHEAKLLEAEERRAEADTRLTMTDDGHGRTYLRATLPTLQAAMLRKALLAIAAPKHQAQAAAGALGERRPGPDRMGHAFREYIDRYPVDRLPHAGGVAATVVVTMTLESLLDGLQVAQLDTGDQITAGEARRLACEAGIIPALLGTGSEVLDLGRRTRLHTTPMRIATGIRDRGCTAAGCDWPPAMCHAHHHKPWGRGGGTSVKDGRLLCPRHHTLTHRPDHPRRT